MSDISVGTTYTTGTTINMDAVNAASFLKMTAINVIMMVDCITDNYDGSIFNSTSKLPGVDSLIDKYCDGVHGAVLMNILSSNVDILFAFVQDIVLNESSKGLYLLARMNRKENAPYMLILEALEKATELCSKRADISGNRFTENMKFNKYNEQFKKLMENEFYKSIEEGI